jgi:rhodanese-related sulfurtransferase
VRSVRAATAATHHGFARACNILEGFEGKIDANGQRGHIDGWRRAGLPWKQD